MQPASATRHSAHTTQRPGLRPSSGTLTGGWPKPMSLVTTRNQGSHIQVPKSVSSASTAATPWPSRRARRPSTA